MVGKPLRYSRKTRLKSRQCYWTTAAGRGRRIQTAEATARDNQVMRKRILGSAPLPTDAHDGRAWLNLQELAEVEVTSEADGYPIESALNFGAGPGWRAASPGKQCIRLAFDRPQSIQRMLLQFNEPEGARTQEFTVRWSGGPASP